jgi:hypothetical protein
MCIAVKDSLLNNAYSFPFFAYSLRDFKHEQSTMMKEIDYISIILICQYCMYVCITMVVKNPVPLHYLIPIPSFATFWASYVAPCQCTLSLYEVRGEKTQNFFLPVFYLIRYWTKCYKIIKLCIYPPIT